MKAIVCEKYGPPEFLKLKEVATPVPKAGEVLIKVHATAVNSGDWRIRSLEVPAGFGLFVRLAFGFSRPRQPVLGIVLAGEVATVGKDITKFKAGDQVFAMDGTNMGCHAEYKVMPEDGAIAFKPENLSFAEAAALPFGGTTALDYLRTMAKLQSGEKILINGASGAVGTAAVQLAKHFGAEVTGVCSTRNVELVKSLGADHVIDYTQEDFTRNGETYDVIMDTVGNAPFARSGKSLKENGRLLAVVADLPEILKSTWVTLTSKKKIISGTAQERAEDLQWLGDLAAAGTFKPVIDREYAFEEMVEAHRHVDTGHKRGNVVITLQH